ncbi:hypothetical protein D3C87_1987970 [compost metagenome]
MTGGAITGLEIRPPAKFHVDFKTPIIHCRITGQEVREVNQCIEPYVIAIFFWKTHIFLVTSTNWNGLDGSPK